MKAKKLVSLALPIMLVSVIGTGCLQEKIDEDVTAELKAADEKIDKKYEKKNEEARKAETDEKAKDPANVKAEKEYKVKLNSLMGEYTSQINKLHQILANDKPVAEKSGEYHKESEVFTAITDKVIALDPGEKYKEVHILMKGAMSETAQGVLMIDSGLALKSDDLIHKGGETLTNASNKMFEADKKMKEIR
ncbi:hypothetical protein [Bacillus pseudomycoides]|uniref:hypothetical protein n=1 Tax=Bacillus pseudomycoides TaxID=64104 RepID=UPI002FFEF736